MHNENEDQEGYIVKIKDAEHSGKKPSDFYE